MPVKPVLFLMHGRVTTLQQFQSAPVSREVECQASARGGSSNCCLVGAMHCLQVHPGKVEYDQLCFSFCK